jgi:hypothetical protein
MLLDAARKGKLGMGWRHGPGTAQIGDGEGPAWYGPAEVIETTPTVITGHPMPARISTSYIERQNLTMRMMIRRFTRPTNAFSKKLANLKAQVALHFAHYNFARIHQTLRVMPAMEAGITDHVWTIGEIIGKTSV